MTSNRPMFLSFIAEAVPAIQPVPPPEGMPTWLSGLLAFSGGGLGVGILTFFREKIRDNRKAIEAQTARAERKEDATAKGDATVEVARVQAKAELESKYFTSLENERATRSNEIAALRSEFDSAKRTLGHEIRNLRNALNLTQEVYHQLWTACTMLAMQCRIMRSRIKKAEGDAFDETEFPQVEIEVFDPKKLFARLSSEPPAEPDARKLTGRIIITPDKP